jgi:hypothetical protein
MSFFLVEPTYYKLRLLVEAKTPFGARHRAKQWILKNKGVYIMDHELEVQKISDPDTVQNVIRI